MPEYMHAGGRAGKTWMCGETWRRALREQTRNIEKNAAYNNAEAKGKKRVFFKAEWTCARVHASHLNPRTERVKNKENVHYSHTYVLPDIFPHSPPSSVYTVYIPGRECLRSTPHHNQSLDLLVPPDTRGNQSALPPDRANVKVRLTRATDGGQHIHEPQRTTVNSCSRSQRRRPSPNQRRRSREPVMAAPCNSRCYRSRPAYPDNDSRARASFSLSLFLPANDIHLAISLRRPAEHNRTVSAAFCHLTSIE